MEAASVEVEGLSAAQGMLLAVADQHDAAIDDIAEFLAVMRLDRVKLSPPSGSSSSIGSI